MATETKKLEIPSSKVEISLTPGSTEGAMKAAEAKTSKLYLVPTGSIKVIPGFNVRIKTPDYLEHRDTIANSIVANGYDPTNPLAGYVAKEDGGNVIYITDGHTRLDAVNMLTEDGHTGFESLPVLVGPDDRTLTDLTVALHTSNNGRGLTPFELGVVVKRLLKDEANDKATIATRLGVTPRYLDNVLLLVNSPKKVRDLVLAGKVSSTLAIDELARDPEAAADRLSAAVEKVGGKKVTKKNVGTKMQKLKLSVAVTSGSDMKEIVKAVAKLVRESIPNATVGDDEEVKLASTDGTINLLIEVPATEKPKAKPKSKAKSKPAKAAPAEPEAEAEVVAEKPKAKPNSKAKPEPAPAAAEDDDDLGIEGAEALNIDLDAETVIAPPAVKNGDGVADDADDI